MKRYLSLILMAVLFSAVSCHRTNVESIGQGELVDDKGKKMDAYEQRSKLETVGKSFLQEVDVDHWKASADFLRKVSSKFEGSEYDVSEMEDWAEDMENLLVSETYENPYTVTKVTARLSAIKGRFTEKGNRFVRSDSDDLSLVFTVDGEQVTMTFTAKERNDDLLVADVTDDRYGERTTVYVRVPRSADLVITRGSKPFFHISISLDVDDVDHDGCLTPDKDSFGLSVSCTLDEYSIELKQAEYASDHAVVSMVWSRGKQKLLAYEARAKYRVDYDMKDWDDAEAEFLSADLSVDILGKVQLKGYIPDYAALEHWMDLAYDANDNEESFRKYVAEAEKCISVGVYYDGGKTLQATLGLEPYYETGYDYGRRGWEVMPVIRFADGTSYSFESFFNEEEFSDLFEALEDWIAKINRMLGID